MLVRIGGHYRRANGLDRGAFSRLPLSRLSSAGREWSVGTGTLVERRAWHVTNGRWWLGQLAILMNRFHMPSGRRCTGLFLSAGMFAETFCPHRFPMKSSHACRMPHHMQDRWGDLETAGGALGVRCRSWCTLSHRGNRVRGKGKKRRCESPKSIREPATRAKRG